VSFHDFVQGQVIAAGEDHGVPDLETEGATEKRGKAELRRSPGKKNTASGRSDFVVGEVNLGFFAMMLIKAPPG